MKPHMSCLIFMSTLIGLMFLPKATRAEEGDLLWSRIYGGNSDDGAASIIPSGDGGFLLAGWTASFGADGYNMWLVKVDANGDSVWSHTYGGWSDDGASSIVPSGDGGFVLAGGTNSFGAGGYDMWLVKVDANGDSVWSRTYGGLNADMASSIISSGDGGFVLAGGTESFGAGGDDMWLVKVNADGQFLWSHTYGGSDEDYAFSIISSGDGGFLLAGRTWSFGAGNYDMWLVKVNANGDSLWSHTYGGSSNDWAYSVIPADDNCFLLAGCYDNPIYLGGDMGLVKVDAYGNALWTKGYWGNATECAHAIIPSGDGGFLMAGDITNSFMGNQWIDMYLLKVNANYDYVWSQTYGGGDDDYASAIIPSDDGGFLVAGNTWSFGGWDDMWLVKVEGPPNAVEPQAEVRPVQFALYPAFPNPFNPSTDISYKIQDASYVSLRVYDTAGRLVETLVDGWREAGEHRATFDGSRLPSGVYLYHLQAGEAAASGKMVLLK